LEYLIGCLAMARHILHTKILTLLPLAGIVVGILNLPQIIVFTVNLLALSVLVDWINRSVNAISVNTGRLTNELLKGTLGNAVELMVKTLPFYFTVGDH
jgi:Ca2+/H+ antiporter